jgi:hypothetical protein
MNGNQFKPTIGEEDVISLEKRSPDNIVMYDPTLKVKDIVEYCLTKVLEVNELNELKTLSSYKRRAKWIDEGVDCEVLNLGANQWKKGKVRIKISFEFCPDEPEISEYESPLDEIRREMQNQS